jgi:hypothetical protein
MSALQLTAENFKKALDSVSEQQLTQILDSWVSRPAYTLFAKTSLMPKVALEFGLATAVEFNRTDIVFYDPTRFCSTASYADVLAAVELENDFGKSDREITKLSILDVPLKVLITFANPWIIKDMLPIFAAIANSNSEINEDRLLVVFGPYGMKRPTILEWSYHVYRNGQFHSV